MISRVIDPVRIAQQGPRQSAQLQELMPFPATACQPRHLDAQHDAHMIQPDLGTSRQHPGRVSAPDAEWPRSSSITSTLDGAHPSPTARSASPYCSRVDSWWSWTCCAVDWRT